MRNQGAVGIIVNGEEPDCEIREPLEIESDADEPDF